VTHTAVGIKVLLGVANELLDDSEIDGGLAADILRDFREAVNYREDFLCLSADGTNDDLNGAQTGIFEGGTAVTAAAGNTTMETLDFEDVTAVTLGGPSAMLMRQARWWMNPKILIRLLHIKDNNGRPIFLTATEAPTPGGIGSILGYGVNLSAAAPSANTAGSNVAVFGDPNGMVTGRRKLFEFKSSSEANFSDDETLFRGISRFGNKIRLATAFQILKLAAS
jgi:HK97 family phage major capsid protein